MKNKLLANLSTTFQEEFYKCSKQKEFRKGSSPFFPDDLLKYFYIVIDGKIRTYQFNFDTSKEQTLFIYRKGDMFDTISLLDDKPHEVSYEVIENCKVLEIPIDRVRYWIENDTIFNRKFFPYIASQMRYTEDLSVELSLYDTKDRLMNLLVQNSNQNSHYRYNLLQDLSNTQIASLLGTVRHVVERSLKQLKEQNIIEVARKNIKIKNLEKLLEKTTQMLLK